MRWLVTASAGGVALAVVLVGGMMLVRAQASPPTGIVLVLDAPASGATVVVPFVVSGAAADGEIGTAFGNAGIASVTVDASDGGSVARLGSAVLGVPDARGDPFGPAFENVGWAFTATAPLVPGTYTSIVTATSLAGPSGVTNTTQLTRSITIGGGGAPPTPSPPPPGSPTTLGELACLAGQVPQWSGTQWVCASAGVGPPGPKGEPGAMGTPGADFSAVAGSVVLMDNNAACPDSHPNDHGLLQGSGGNRPVDDDLGHILKVCVK